MSKLDNLSIILLFLLLWESFAESSSINQQVEANASFSEDHVTINVVFSEEVRPRGSYENCTTIFDAITKTLLGSMPICAFANMKNIEIWPYKDATVKPGFSLAFNEGYLSTLNGSMVNISEITIASFSQSNIIQPEAVITNDGYSSNCSQDIRYLSADYSKNAGYKHLTYNIRNFNNAVENTPSGAMIAANDSEIQMTNTLISTDQLLLFNLQNVFGGNVNRSLTISADGQPVGRILGERRIALHPGKAIYLVAELAATKCGPEMKNVTYKWSISPNDGLQVMNDMTSKVLAVGHNLSISKEMFNISVSISYQLSNDEVGNVMDSVTIAIRKTSLKAKIIGGDRMIGKDQTLILYGTELTGRRASLDYHWNCRDAETKEICKTNDTQLELAIGNASIVSVNMAGGHFTVGRRYKFTLTISTSLQTASASIIVTITSSAVDMVTITTDRVTLSYDNEIFLHAVVNGANNAIGYKWKIEDLFGDEIKIDSSSGNSTSDVAVARMNRIVTLKMPKKSLKAEFIYRISLQVTTGNIISQGNAMQRVSMPPRYGLIVMNPKEGVAYNTTFRIRSFGWIDKSDHQPFQFRFGYINHKNSQSHYLTTWRNLNVLPKTMLPVGDANNDNKLTVFAEVRTTNGLIAREQMVLQVTAQAIGDQESLTKYFQQMKTFADYEQLSTVIIGILKSAISLEQKRLHVGEYFASVENASLWPDLALIFIESIWEISNVDTENSNNPVLTKYLKGRIIVLLKKFLSKIDEAPSGFKMEKNQIAYISEIIENVMPRHQDLTNEDAKMVESFNNAMGIFANLLCKSVQYGKKMQNNSVVSISSEYADLATPLVANKIWSISKAFREHLQLGFYGSKSAEFAGFCLSMISFMHKNYVSSLRDSDHIVTLVHIPKLLNLFDNKIIDTANSGHPFIFTLPVVADYSKADFSLQCKMQNPSTNRWEDNHCKAAKVTASSDGEFLQCECEKLYPIVGFKISQSSLSSTTMKPVTGSMNNESGSASTTTVTNATVNSTLTLALTTTLSPLDIITIVMDGNCTKYLQDEEKPKFVNSFTTNMAFQLQISVNRIRILSIECGSVIINLTIEAKTSSSSEPTKAAAISNLRGLLSNGLMRISIYDGILAAVAPGVNISTLPTIPSPTTRKPIVPEFKTNWMPLFVSFVFAVVAVILIAACIAWIHGRYYKKKHYTDINCNKPKKKVQAEDENDPKVLNRKERRKKLDSVMEESLAEPAFAMSSSSASMSSRRKKKRSSITPLALNSLPNLTNSLKNRNVFTIQKPIREVPRLALDDSSSDSEQETSFSDVTEKNNDVK